MCVNEIEIVVGLMMAESEIQRAISHIISSKTTDGERDRRVKECDVLSRISGRDEKEIQFFKMTHNYSL